VAVRSVPLVRGMFVLPSDSLGDAIRVIDRGAVQACLVVNESGKLVGMLSDGDVRRALLGGHSMEAVVGELMNADFRFMRAPANPRSAEDFMGLHQIRHVPVLNASGQVEQFFTLSDSPVGPGVNLPVVVMAGGQGMRLRPLTEQTPKPMLPVGNKPMLERILDRCSAAGLTEIYLSVNYLASQIRDYFGDGSRWGLTIRYLEEEEALGTAGPLGLLPAGLEDSVVVLNGDVLTEVDLSRMVEFHRDRESFATVALREFVVEVPYGVVALDGFTVQEIREKPSFRHFVNAGVYVLRREVIDLVPSGQAIDMPDLIHDVIDKGFSVSGFPLHEDWLDVGSFESLEQAREKHE
jgi:dTDP-glucose pyrophosphorylase